MIAKVDECDLSLKIPELGMYKYKLKLKGLKPTSQRSLHFKTSLGLESVQVYRFMHYLKKPTAYSVKIEKINSNGV